MYRVTIMNNSLQGFETHDFEDYETAIKCANEFFKLVLSITRVEKNQFGFNVETEIKWRQSGNGGEIASNR